MQKDHLEYLFKKYIDKTCTEAERAEFLLLLNDPAQEEMLQKISEGYAGMPFNGLELDAESTRSMKRALMQIAGEQTSLSERVSVTFHRIHFLKTTWFRYAAILLLFAGAAIFLYRRSTPEKVILQARSASEHVIRPGGNKALLTLSDGRVVVLDSAADGLLANQGNTRIMKLASGGVAYNAGSSNGEVLYNTISTPRGGQYHAVLPDGSRVWLNAASSITFPAGFTGKERRVAIKGEVYFEIASNAIMPFYASAAGTEVQVLGTSFNINAYPDEDNVRTTLLEGSVRIRAHEQLRPLLPGQQSQTSANRAIIVPADVKKVMAWKNGLFDFEGATLQEVMRQIARWYDVEVVYEKNIPGLTFLGKIQRDFDLTEVLEVLKQTGVHYRLKDRTITILP